MAALQLTEEQKDKIQPWLCRIASDKDIKTPNGLRIETDRSFFDPETGRYSVRVYDEDADEDSIIAHGVTLVFEDSRIDSLIEDSRPLYWRQAQQEQEVAAREGDLIVRAIKAMRKGLFIDDPHMSSYRDDLWHVICRKGRKGDHSVWVKIVRVADNPSGKVRVHVTGRYDGPKKDFRQRQDGSVNHEAIAQFVLDAINEQEQYAEAQEKRNEDFSACRAAISAAGAKHGIATHFIAPDCEGKVRISFQVTSEELDHAIEVLVREGLIKQRSMTNLIDDD